MRQRHSWPPSVKWIRGGLILLGSGMILIAGAILTVNFIHSGLRSEMPDNDSLKWGEANEMKAKSDTVVLADGALVIYEYHYALCGHRKTEVKNASLAMAGLSQDEIAKANPDMQISEFSPGSFKAVIILNLYCPDHFILKAVDGMVDIYQTNQDDRGIELKKKLSLPLIEFESERAEDLQTGIAFDTLESLEEFLDDQEV